MTDYPIATSGIAAQAMEYLELRPVSSTADDSDDARALKRALPVARRMCLEAGDFTVASRMAQVFEEAGSDADLHPDFQYGYGLPSDLVVLRDVFSDDQPISYTRQGKHLLTECAGRVVIRYTRDEENELILPPFLQQAVALQTAILMADLRSTSASKKEMLARRLQDAMRQARRADRAGASPDRYDEWAGQGDWVTEAIR